MQNWLSKLILTPDYPITDDCPQRIASAVLLPVFKQNQQWRLIFIRRSHTLAHHKGQFAFPGGRFETEDNNLSVTALREAYEEIRLEQHQVKLIAKLPNQDAGKRFTMTPYVGLLQHKPQLYPNTAEVTEIFHLPLDPFLQPRHYLRLKTSDGQNKRVIDFIEVNNRVIWGATAAVLYQLACRLTGLNLSSSR
ncbi:NUDIX hydrolase [Celerinatantimonas diazotrophica]|uniref:8-oxo-dGTP pyrophosphatase MutT (NUDIX family) n=1 Tax=Celerinatantimonas diazotrophica TaxID=412034 RepID=A0A4R1J8U1_9GAMM|nr:CoA pyrophosphatase [Celerinatantimonas diazotrophica]TCK46475.1 8-oxo-dGTP pyrophosphatase MutT (NUDIX family) [Celerinatantimonas diazotrophica]CAG9296525.1 putative Nudix hydrolase NudL [Celerinatantimonas diazotrophica]